MHDASTDRYVSRLTPEAERGGRTANSPPSGAQLRTCGVGAAQKMAQRLRADEALEEGEGCRF